MSVPKPNPPGHSPVGTGQIVLIVCGVFGFAALLCCGGLGLLGAIFYTRVDQTAGQVRQAIQNVPAPAAKWNEDWLAVQALTTVYTAVVDAAVKDPRLIERLGEPIETVDSEAGLFRREQSGSLTSEETFEFDLVGPKGKATIIVECSPGIVPSLAQEPPTVTARFEDKSELHLPPPEVEPR